MVLLEELKAIMDWSLHHDNSTFSYLCGKHRPGCITYFSINKYILEQKYVWGFSLIQLINPTVRLLRGFDD